MTTHDQLKLDGTALVGGAVGLIMGVWVGLGPVFQALLVVMGADVLTGIIAAGSLGEISSSKAGLGLRRKAATIIVVLAVGFFSENVGQQLGFSLPGGQALAGAFIVQELVSLLENAHRTGLDLGPFAKFLAVAKPPAPSDPVDTVLKEIGGLSEADRARLVAETAQIGKEKEAGGG